VLYFVLFVKVLNYNKIIY